MTGVNDMLNLFRRKVSTMIVKEDITFGDESPFVLRDLEGNSFTYVIKKDTQAKVYRTRKGLELVKFKNHPFNLTSIPLKEIEHVLTSLNKTA